MTKTAAEKLLNPAGHRPINLGAVSPVPFPKSAPKHLSDEERAIWKDLARAWRHNLTGGDAARFEKHIILEALFSKAYEEGDAVEMIKLNDRLEKGYQVFGGTPLARLKFKGDEVSYTKAKHVGNAAEVLLD